MVKVKKKILFDVFFWVITDTIAFMAAVPVRNVNKIVLYQVKDGTSRDITLPDHPSHYQQPMSPILRFTFF